MKQPKFAITHASSLLAEALLEEMSKSGLKPDSVVLLDGEDNAGSRLAFADTYLTVEDQTEYDYEDLTAVLLMQADAELESLLQHADCYVLSHYEDENASPVFIGTDDAAQQLPAKSGAIKLASAELSTLLTVVQPLQALAELQSLQVVNVLSASSSGKAGVDELASQTVELLNGRDAVSSIFPLQLAFNMIPQQVATHQAAQLQALLSGSETKCSVQNIVVPAFHGVATSVVLEFEQVIDLKKLKQRLKAIPSVKLTDEPVSPITHCKSGKKLLVFGLNQTQNDAKRLQFWIIADTVRNGLLRNYQNVMEVLLKSFL